MAKTNWGAGFYLDTEALVFEAADREERGQGRVLPGSDNCAPRWIPHPKLGKGKKPDGLYSVPQTPKAHGERRASKPSECGPTKETAAKIKACPTCFIQRAVHEGHLSESMGQGVDEFAKVRYNAGMSGKRYRTTLGQFQPHDGAAPINEDQRRIAFAQYIGLIDSMSGAESDALSTLVEQAMPQDIDAMKRGAKKMRDILIAGVDRRARVA